MRNIGDEEGEAEPDRISIPRFRDTGYAVPVGTFQTHA
ncbi:Uncharacterized protein dnm_000390 [Desulfonema magnum]|uniref:Uncharacterized protein n=1 Tax=Desulfonema magnum TaxID=45655 RepID=A0A975BER6_9BACT|nr:Uncharacterized protein dnm_000390 [Desulfonema magnum]